MKPRTPIVVLTSVRLSSDTVNISTDNTAVLEMVLLSQSCIVTVLLPVLACGCVE